MATSSSSSINSIIMIIGVIIMIIVIMINAIGRRQPYGKPTAEQLLFRQMNEEQHTSHPTDKGIYIYIYRERERI